MLVIHIMSKHPETIQPEDSLAKAQEMMEAGEFRSLPVVKDGTMVGMLTERDLRQHRGHLEHTKVNGAMTAPVVSVGLHSTVQEAARLILRYRIGGLPVVEKDKLVGMVTTTDMIRALLQIVEDSEQKP